MIRKTLAALALAALGAGLAAAEDAGKTYKFGMHDKHTNITFVSEAEIENIYGMSHTAGGGTWLDFDGLKGKCSITVPVKSLDTGIPLRNEHLQSDAWLDAEKFPEVAFASDGFDLVAKNKDKGLYEAKVKGKLTIHGVTKEIDTTAKVVKLSPALSAKIGDGEWVRVTCGFDVTLKDFDVTIPSGPVVAKVSPTWTVKFDCYASSERKDETEGR